MSAWYDHLCPCGVKNWINNGDEGDCSRLDVEGFRCHTCGKTVILYGGDLRDEYGPHYEGEEPADDEAALIDDGLVAPHA